MSARLGGALAEYLRRELRADKRNFVLIEGIPVGVAEGMSRSWDERLPRLAVVSSEPARFGGHALQHVSGTQLRNDRSSTRGVVLVLCDGEQVPDRQSLNLFDSVSPAVLLANAEGMGILSQQSPAVDLDGPARAVREAINQVSAASRPSATSVASYLDELAIGTDPLLALPTLGGFRDRLTAGTRADSVRISDNLALAGRRTSDELLKSSAFADLRRRAASVLERRPDVGRAGSREAADRVMAELQSGDASLLRSLWFDEAREIFEQRTENLTTMALREMGQFRAGLEDGSQAHDLPWKVYEQRAEELRSGTQQKEAARELCDLDDSQRQQIFAVATRRKIERLLRDKAISGSKPSCPEAAIVKGAQQLGGMIQRVEVRSPEPPATGAAMNRSSAGRVLTLACARLRLGALVRAWERLGAEIDGLLLRAADDGDLGDLHAALADAALSTGGSLPPLQLRLHASDGTTVQVDWSPDLDDVATLRSALFFAEAPTLSLELSVEPTLQGFCSTPSVGVTTTLPAALLPVARALQKLAQDSLERGLDPTRLREWGAQWTRVCLKMRDAGETDGLEAMAVAGAVLGGDRAAALTPFAPMKAEWLAQYLDSLWRLIAEVEEPSDRAEAGEAVASSNAIARSTASHHPAHLQLSTHDRVLLPTSEGRLWSLFGGTSHRDESGYAGDALTSIVTQLLTLQPEAAGHLRCLAWGSGAADLLVREAVGLIGKRAGLTTIQKIEVFCVGISEEDRPRPETLAYADDQLRSQRDVLELRYIEDLSAARELLRPSATAPAVHLALVTGLTNAPSALQIESPEVALPDLDDEVLFAPRVWQRAQKDRRILLMPPSASQLGRTWLLLQNAIEDAWPDDDELVRVPEVRTGALDLAPRLREVHDLALWVATLDRYATRDSLEHALGGGQNVAILHQERRLGGDSPLSLVLSQRSGGPADRAIGRSLRAAGIISDVEVALEIGTQLREVASQGYGILALQAATSGAGINELVGHVVAFSLLANTTTPWPLPPGCRVLLVSLDEYRHWFPGKRADLLAIALDTKDRGVHVATIEVKARRSDENDAAAGALDQLNQTLAVTQWAAYPKAGSVHSRLWLNRIAEAAYAVARESRFKLSADEIGALEEFRRGRGTLEWAGVGLVFGPKVEPFQRTYRTGVASDIVPVVLHGVQLTEDLLRRATSTKLTELRTVEADRPPLVSTRTRRRPEAGVASGVSSQTPPSSENDDHDQPGGNPFSGRRAASPGEGVESSSNAEETGSEIEGPAEPGATEDELTSEPGVTEHVAALATNEAGSSAGNIVGPKSEPVFDAPLLGWDATSNEEVRWHPAGPGQTALQNGHTEIWGSSGMGKTQFTMCLLGQLAHHSGSRFGIADFKNDYSDETGFPAFADAEFVDLWNGGAPYNPLALDDPSPRAIQSAVIELRDTVDEAVRSVGARLGVRQKAKLEEALTKAYGSSRLEGRWPTLRTLDDNLDQDLSGVIGDLTKNDLFKSGEPLGAVIGSNVVFGLSKIPGNGQTTVLAAGFIFSALLLRVQNLVPAHNTIRYIVVVDEAHRVANFKAIQTMIREGRSKGLAVLLATQGPVDLPDVVAANAQTKICFGLPDATIATMAARKMEPGNPRLAEQIRTLDKGEAFVSFKGEAPRLVKMVQAWRDGQSLGLSNLGS
ncbi:ATP-binding protein [Nocardioides rubriscoriae]|uniref:ATP-binding protein n=1 Tax=Nocardioides rubriscoriae TaxID=642762 RepID=UPI0011DF0C67|nr:DUF853 family protein [Nocardioides rubriscoriae]